MSEYCYLPLFLLAGFALLFLFSKVLAAVVSIPTRGERQESDRATRQAALTARKVAVLRQISLWKTGTAPQRLWDKYYQLEAEEQAIMRGVEAQAGGQPAEARWSD